MVFRLHRSISWTSKRKLFREQLQPLERDLQREVTCFLIANVTGVISNVFIYNTVVLQPVVFWSFYWSVQETTISFHILPLNQGAEFFRFTGSVEPGLLSRSKMPWLQSWEITVIRRGSAGSEGAPTEGPWQEIKWIIHSFRVVSCHCLFVCVPRRSRKSCRRRQSERLRRRNELCGGERTWRKCEECVCGVGTDPPDE